jgi:two-component system LytT family response regulator
MKAILIDDNSQARKLLRLMLLEYAQDVVVIGEAENAESGLRLIENIKADVVFLDIEMPGKTGIQLAEELSNRKIEIAIVFTTAYNSYAIQAFRLSATDYLLKPIQEDQLLEAIDKLRNQITFSEYHNKLDALQINLRETQSKLLCIPVQGGSEFVPIEEIIYLEADGSYVNVVCINGRNRVVSKNLKYFENTLNGLTQFVRTHRSFIVNMNYLFFHSKSESNIHLKNGMKIPVSRERKQSLIDFLTNLNKN